MSIFSSVTLRGVTGELVWRYQPAAAFSAWAIYHHARDAQHDGKWLLTATCRWVDDYRIRQADLIFTAPRDKGRWCWSVKAQSIVRHGQGLRAELGPPEQ